MSEGRNLRTWRATGIIPFSDAQYVLGEVNRADPALFRPTLDQAIMARSVSSDSAGRTIVIKVKPGISPSDAEYEAHVAGMSQGRRLWDAAGDSWRCPCCERSKREVVRKSKKGAWTGRLHSTRDWVREDDPVNLAKRERTTDIVVYGGYVVRAICHDCRAVTTKMQQRNQALGDVYLSTDQIRAVLSDIGPNREHSIAFEDAYLLLLENRERGQAIRDFEKHEQSAIEVSNELTMLVSQGWSNPGAMAAIVNRIFEAIQAEWNDVEDYVEWLVGEGDRLKEIRRDEARQSGEATGL